MIKNMCVYENGKVLKLIFTILHLVVVVVVVVVNPRRMRRRVTVLGLSVHLSVCPHTNLTM